MKRFFILFFLLTVTSINAFCNQLEIVEEQVPQRVEFARPFEIKYVLAHEPGSKVVFDPNSISKDFTISQYVSDQTSPGVVSYDFTVFPFVLGKSTFTITFNLMQDMQIVNTTDTLANIEVAQVQLFKDKNFKEIRAPKAPASWYIWLLITLVIIAILVVLYWWYSRVKKDTLVIKNTQDNRPCEVSALAQIDFLLDSGIWEQKQYKMFYITLFDILRDYLRKQLKIDTSADTSTEFLKKIKKVPQLSSLSCMQNLRTFLNSADLVKFAKVIPTDEIRNRDIAIVKETILETSPKEMITPQTVKEGKQ